MTKRQKRDSRFVLTFAGEPLNPIIFENRVAAERVAKYLNRRGNYKLYKAENFSRYTENFDRYVARKWGAK